MPAHARARGLPGDLSYICWVFAPAMCAVCAGATNGACGCGRRRHRFGRDDSDGWLCRTGAFSDRAAEGDRVVADGSSAAQSERKIVAEALVLREDCATSGEPGLSRYSRP
jgi:hypothetical protein